MGQWKTFWTRLRQANGKGCPPAGGEVSPVVGGVGGADPDFRTPPDPPPPPAGWGRWLWTGMVGGIRFGVSHWTGHQLLAYCNGGAPATVVDLRPLATIADLARVHSVACTNAALLERLSQRLELASGALGSGILDLRSYLEQV